MIAAMKTRELSPSRAYSDGSFSSFKCVPTCKTSHGVFDSATLQQIQEAYFEAQEDDWDGYGGAKISKQTVRSAIKFAVSLPTTFPRPDVSAESDGEICFDWALSRNRVFSVSIGSSPKICYAGLFGESRAKGTEIFGNQIPQLVLSYIRRVYK